jgi:hypothetical protein
MRTILAFLLLGSTGTLPLHSQEVPFQEFQAKIKKAYYSYEKEGLRGFTCGLQSALVEKKLAEQGLTGVSQGFAKMALGLEYTLSYGPKGVSVTCPKAAPVGDAEKDKALREGKEKARYWLEKGLGAWFFLSSPQGAQKIDPTVGAPKIEKTDKGWKMSLQRGEDQASLYFDPSLTMTHADIHPKGEEPVRVGLRFMKNPEGLQLQVAQARYKGKLYKAQAKYIKTRGAFLPEKFTFYEVDAKTKKAKVLDILTFENPAVER